MTYKCDDCGTTSTRAARCCGAPMKAVKKAAGGKPTKKATKR